MNSPARTLSHALTRLLISSGVGALAGTVTWLIGVATVTYAWPAPIFVGSGLLVGMSGGLGAELGMRVDRPPSHRRLRWILAFAALSALYGAACVTAARIGVSQIEDAPGASLLWIAVGGIALGAGLISGRGRWAVRWLDGLLALVLVLAGALAAALGAGLAYAVTFVNPCHVLPGQHGYCLDLSRWMLLDALVPPAAVAGLWLGVVLWLALVASRALGPDLAGQPESNSIASLGG